MLIVFSESLSEEETLALHRISWALLFGAPPPTDAGHTSPAAPLELAEQEKEPGTEVPGSP